MADQQLLLTVVIEAPSPLDKESSTYRRLLSAKLNWGSSFQVKVVNHELNTEQLKTICEECNSLYIIVVHQTHQLSNDYIQGMLEYLQINTVYMVEPYKYLSAIPFNVANTSLDRSYYYTQDLDVHGIAFNAGRLADALDAEFDLDRMSINLAYRIYWSIGDTNTIEIGYSVTSDSKAAIGYNPAISTTRLLPLIDTDSDLMRAKILRLIVLYLRGLRESGATNISINHLRDLVAMFKLKKYLVLAEKMNPFEAAWIRWLANPESNIQQFKKLSEVDARIKFTTISLDDKFRINAEIPETSVNMDTSPDAAELAVVLQRIRLNEDQLTIQKIYQSRKCEKRSPEIYDFYSRPISSASIILFFDRPEQADDNAEYLYSHFTSMHPEFTEAYFALNPKSPDWERLRSRGFRLVKMFSPEFYGLFLRSDLVVSSQIYNLNYRGKSFANSRFVYLQHGIQLNDMSNWVASKHFDIFVATGQVEAEYLRTVAPMETLNSGLPRLQTLKASPDSKRTLLFMPTWRFNLHQASREDFRNSNYCRAIDAVLTDKRLLAHLESTDAVLRVKLHPNIDKRSHHFHFSSRVQKSNDSYRRAISEAEFVFTDYSSAVLDAAFISTPIAYYQWDSHNFFDGQLYESRLDYAMSGLGPVFTEHEQIVNHIVSGDYRKPNAEYSRRREYFFEGVDPNQINETIIERMLNL